MVRKPLELAFKADWRLRDDTDFQLATGNLKGCQVEVNNELAVRGCLERDAGCGCMNREAAPNSRRWAWRNLKRRACTGCINKGDHIKVGYANVGVARVRQLDGAEELGGVLERNNVNGLACGG